MMEQIIRPFLPPGALATRRIPLDTTEVDTMPGSITWGKAGTMPTASQLADPATFGMSFKVNDPYSEKWVARQRVVQKQRIENPDDPSQFVDVEKTVRTTYDKTNRDAPTAQTVYTDAYGNYITSNLPATPVRTSNDVGGATTTSATVTHFPE